MSESVAVTVTALTMPSAFVITNGEAFDLISHGALKIMTGATRQSGIIPPTLNALFLLRFAVR